MNQQDFLYHVISSRRSVRRFTEEPVPQAVLERILEAATWAPSAHNRQPWRFAVVTSPEMRRSLALRMGERLRHDLQRDGVDEKIIELDTTRSYARLTSAAALIVLCLTMADMDTYNNAVRQSNEYLMAAQSVAMAGQNLLLMAHNAGLGACWMCAPLFCPDAVQTALELPEDWQPQGLIALGIPAETRQKTRQPLETRVVWR